jgi:hypothetical protein
MSLTKLPLGRNNSVMTSLFPPRESLVVTSRLGTGNSRTFFTVHDSIKFTSCTSSTVQTVFFSSYYLIAVCTGTKGQMRGKRADRKGRRLVNVNKRMLCTVYFLLPVAEAEITLTTGKGRWVGSRWGVGGHNQVIGHVTLCNL